MSVIIETTLGDLVIDLETELCPKTTKNFLKLCKIHYYNGVIFHNIQKDHSVQTGDPTSTGRGGSSVYGLCYGDQARFFEDEIHKVLKHNKTGVVSMASSGKDRNASQFFITTTDGLGMGLDGKHTVFGQVTEGFDVLEKINNVLADGEGRPVQLVRIHHTIILDDPYDDPPGLLVPSSSPLPKPLPKSETRIEADDALNEYEGLSKQEIIEQIEEKKAEAHTEVLTLLGDLPYKEAAPEQNVLFVCQLNPITTSEDLGVVFSKFGKIKSCDVIKDWKTGDSLQYAFIEFETDAEAENAYFKTDNILLDDRRIHVDFSQSVAKLMIEYKKKGMKAAKPPGAMRGGRSQRPVFSQRSAQMGKGQYDLLFDDLIDEMGVSEDEDEKRERKERKERNLERR
eukprot:CAMPEP_0201480620 /NCGR_PEP_ID=MMETSP0151_2-20130828/5070_1 /ASSEMBLY_ACC=CAM_ASM_000257 /TAXON_ID=200890 /ORGANISM="Paramoeba atlantica, Strain 621/1 / CCAP 1560/9" /LENGTH=397 /DNA_ID=CAMNT_0047862537 /DNA_START=138 /DNA_END=1328 /DNA_ORIENTATION=+